jgi:RimJ/RimL family protein N-acetyltransferase
MRGPEERESTTRGFTSHENRSVTYMVAAKPSLIDVPMPIRTPRLLIRPREPGDGKLALAAVTETWEQLHRWMWWAESLEQFTAEVLEERNRHAIANFLQRDPIELIGIEVARGEPVVWCGFHDIDWTARQCDTGFWVRKSAQGRNIATESTNALLRYAFAALKMRRVGLTHSEGNKASRRIAEKLGFAYEGIQPAANPLPGGLIADRHCYARFSADGLPPVDVHWGRK